MELSPSLEWFNYLGVADSTGATKPGFDAMKRWKALKRE